MSATSQGSRSSGPGRGKLWVCDALLQPLRGSAVAELRATPVTTRRPPAGRVKICFSRRIVRSSIGRVFPSAGGCPSRASCDRSLSPEERLRARSTFGADFAGKPCQALAVGAGVLMMWYSDAARTSWQIPHNKSQHHTGCSCKVTPSSAERERERRERERERERERGERERDPERRERERERYYTYPALRLIQVTDAERLRHFSSG